MSDEQIVEVRTVRDQVREGIAWILVFVMFGVAGWQHYRSHKNWEEALRWKNAYFSWTPQENPPKPIYIPERNDYVCAPGWTPAGAWKEGGVPLNPYTPIGCMRENK
jgi:hypothetical protein